MLGGGATLTSPGKELTPSPTKKWVDSSWTQVDVSKLISDLDEDIRNSEMEKGGGGAPELSRPPLSMHTTASPTVRTSASGGGSMAGPGSGAARVPVTSGVSSGRPQSSSPSLTSSRQPGHQSAGGRVLTTISSSPNTSQISAKVNSDDSDKGLKMKIKRTKSGRQEIVKSDSSTSSSSAKSMNGDMTGGGGSSDSKIDHKSGGGGVGGGGSMNGPGGGPGSMLYNSSSSGSGSGPVSSSASSSNGDSGPPSSGESSPLSPHPGSPSSGKSTDFNMAVTDINGICNNKTTTEFSSGSAGYNPLSSASIQMLTSKKLKVDVGTVTDASTVTEPEILGPCEPGTPVNLDGIVWHETDTGVLVVNVTWRGKTYVGTLLDCARHTNQWSAPRFTDSPEPGGKGRGKRSRNSATPQELEPRKNLRSSKGKGKGGKGNKGSASLPPPEDEFNFPAPASPKEGGKRKKEGSDAEDSKKRKRTSSDSDDSGANPPPPEEELKPPPPVKREPKPVVYSYTMLECPRKDCNKQYKAEDGLRWHVSHSHPEFIGPDGEMRDSAEVEKEEQEKKEEQERRRRRQEKEERKKKEASSRQESGEKGTPAKQIKLEDSKSQPTTPVPDGKTKAPGFPVTALSQPSITSTAAATAVAVTTTITTVTTPSTSTPAQVTSAAPWNPEVQALPNDARLFEDNLKKMKATIDSLSASPVVSSAGPAVATSTSASITPRPQSVEKSKVPATSPAAFSDISEDGEDTRMKDLKLNTSLDGSMSRPPLSGVGVAPPGGLSASPASLAPPARSSPLALPRPPPPASSSSTTTLPRSSISLPGSGVPGPEPGTPEYHKYLAANGFPPFPYPYPVGMDPAYHIQLLKSDPVYKAKWEKDRAERERAFKEQLDKDQGRFSGLSLVKEDRLQATQNRKQPDNSKPEDLRKREPSGDSRPTSRASPMISVKPEFREKEDLKKEVKPEDQGVKPTMETRGPPPGPQTFGYMHPSLVRPPYSLGAIPPPFDPMFVNSGVSPYGLPPGLPGVPSPYLNPSLLSSSTRPPAPFSSFGAADPLLRAPFPLGTAEDLARAAGAPPSLSGTKALDLLQHHASQYYANQKLAELQERALKSPISSMSSTMSRSGSPLVSKPITTLAGNKDGLNPSSATTGVLGSKSPPPLRHVHTHTHTHIGLGYPLLPPGALPSVPSGIPPVGSLPPGALPPPPVGVGSVPFSSPSAYPGKSPT